MTRRGGPGARGRPGQAGPLPGRAKGAAGGHNSQHPLRRRLPPPAAAGGGAARPAPPPGPRPRLEGAFPLSLGHVPGAPPPQGGREGPAGGRHGRGLSATAASRRRRSGRPVHLLWLPG